MSLALYTLASFSLPFNSFHTGVGICATLFAYYSSILSKNDRILCTKFTNLPARRWLFVNCQKFFFIAVTEEAVGSSICTLLLFPFLSLFVLLSIFFFCFFYFASSLSTCTCYLNAYLSILCFLLSHLFFRHLFF